MSSEQLIIRRPFDDSHYGVLDSAQIADVAAAAARGRAAQQEWVKRPVRERAAVFTRLGEVILANRDRVLDTIQDETGKSRLSAFEEVMDAARAVRVFARQAPGLLRPARRAGAIPVLTKTVEHHLPLGLVGIINPWNYPFNLPASDATQALLAGNAVILKPDSQTPHCALLLAELLTEAGLPDGLFQVLVGAGSVLGPEIVEHVDFVMFTGSTATGRMLARACAARLIGFSAELGGKNPLLVLADADLSAAVADLRLGAGHDWNVDMGSLASAKQLATISAHVDDAVAKGATVLAGGRARPDLGPYFYEPTVLADVTEDMTLCREETFGPVVSVYRVADEAEAIARANDSVYGLNASVWSARRGEAVAAQLRAGTVNVNESYAAAWGSHAAPMGGFGESGVGRRHGSQGLLKYTQAQTVAVQRLHPIAPPRGLTNRRYAELMTTAIALLNKLR